MTGNVPVLASRDNSTKYNITAQWRNRKKVFILYTKSFISGHQSGSQTLVNKMPEKPHLAIFSTINMYRHPGHQTIEQKKPPPPKERFRLDADIVNAFTTGYALISQYIGIAFLPTHHTLPNTDYESLSL